jgi:type VI protein secretion system component Hcp
VRLLDAGCAEITQSTDDSGHELEVISFTYRRIEVDHMVGKTSYVDDWSATRN